MKTRVCSKCLATAIFVESGHDEQGRKFDLYLCGTCDNFTRDFLLTEREVVDHEIQRERKLSLEPKALSGNLKQLRMFPPARRTD